MTKKIWKKQQLLGIIRANKKGKLDSVDDNRCSFSFSSDLVAFGHRVSRGMQDEHLIECVKRRQFLYNFRDPKYADSKYKSIAWKEIGEELNQPVHQCKKRWQNIRDLFRKYRTKEDQRPRGQAGGFYRKYRHWDAMQFLVPYFFPKDSLSNTEDSQSFKNRLEEDSSEHRSELDETDDTLIKHNPSEERDMQPLPVENSAPSANESSRLFLEKTVADCDRLLRGILERKTGSSGEALSSNHTALEKYFLAMATSVAQLKKKHQSLIKLRLAEIVAEYERKEYEEEGEANA